MTFGSDIGIGTGNKGRVMTDIVERLLALARQRIDEQRTHYEGCERDHRECLIQRLADEIERLRAELADEEKGRRFLLKTCSEMEAEVATLRARCRAYRKTLRDLNRAHAVLWRVIAIRNDRCSDAIREMATSSPAR